MHGDTNVLDRNINIYTYRENLLKDKENQEK